MIWRSKLRICTFSVRNWAPSENAGTGNLRQPFVTCVGDHIEHDAKLGKMRTDRVDHCRLLASELMVRPMEQQAALLFDRLGRHEPHVGSADRFANGLSVCSIVLLPLDVGQIVGASAAPTSMALPCRWRSRPQHQKRTNALQQNVSLFDHLMGARPLPYATGIYFSGGCNGLLRARRARPCGRRAAEKRG